MQGVGRANHIQDGVVTGHTEQAQANHQHASNGAAAKRDIQRRVNAVFGRFGGTRIGAHRDMHADEAGQTGEHGAKRKTERGVPVEENANGQKQHHTHQADGCVLTRQIGFSAFLNRRRNANHFFVALRLGQYFFNRNRPVGDACKRTYQCQ